MRAGGCTCSVACSALAIGRLAHTYLLHKAGTLVLHVRSSLLRQLERVFACNTTTNQRGAVLCNKGEGGVPERVPGVRATPCRHMPGCIREHVVIDVSVFDGESDVVPEAVHDQSTSEQHRDGQDRTSARHHGYRTTCIPTQDQTQAFAACMHAPS